MYGRCQASNDCTRKATHQIQFRGQPRDPMKVCEQCLEKHRRAGNDITKLR